MTRNVWYFSNLKVKTEVYRTVLLTSKLPFTIIFICLYDHKILSTLGVYSKNLMVVHSYCKLNRKLLQYATTTKMQQ